MLKFCTRREAKILRKPAIVTSVEACANRSCILAEHGKAHRELVKPTLLSQEMGAVESSKNIFEYLDYRSFLADVYKRRKASEYGFSYRSFAKRAGSTSSNYLKLVTDGQRNLTPEMAHRFAEALGLKGTEKYYFCDLVAFNQASTNAERERCHSSLRRYRAFRKVFQLDQAHGKYHSEWYLPAIRELCGARGFRSDPKWIAKKLRPNITVKEVERALKVLIELGMVIMDEEGKIHQVEALVATGDDKPLGHQVVTYHRKMMERAAAALDDVPRDEREIAALTLTVSPRQAAELKRRLYAFRQELLHDSLNAHSDSPVGDDAASEARSEVIQINFQLFPLTYKEGSPS